MKVQYLELYDTIEYINIKVKVKKSCLSFPQLSNLFSTDTTHFVLCVC